MAAIAATTVEVADRPQVMVAAGVRPRPATEAGAIPRRAATVAADHRTAVADHRTAEVVRMAAVAADMGGNSMLDSFPA